MADQTPLPETDRIATVTVEVSYEDALRLWVLVHDPVHAGQHKADQRIQKVVGDAIAQAERDYKERGQ